jgi:hypothetical protein
MPITRLLIPGLDHRVISAGRAGVAPDQDSRAVSVYRVPDRHPAAGPMTSAVATSRLR